MPYVIVSKCHKRKAKRKFLRIFALILTLALFLTIVIALNTYWKSTIPTLLKISEAKISAQTILVVNQAVEQSISTQDFSKLINIERDNDGNVILLTSNTLQVNKIARTTAILSQNRIDELAKEQIEVPFGTISGIPLFSEMGPDIVITVTPIGAVNCKFTSTFESVGINQTLHRMYIEISCTLDLIIPQMHHTMQCVVPILVSESVIVGKVPNTYLQGGFVMGDSDAL